MNLMFAGSGTGGHLLVGLGVAEEVKMQFPDSKILFFVTGKDIEIRCVSKRGFEVLPLNASPWKKSVLHIPEFVFRHFKGIFRSLKTIKQFKPDVVVGLGGYSSVPPLVAALLLGVPYVLLEQNVIPGKANRLMARWAKGVYSHFPECGVRISDLGIPHLQVTGTPIRKGILDMDREKAAKTLKSTKIIGGLANLFGELSPFKKTLLVMGGSQGAKSINDVIIQCLPELEKLSQTLQIIHCAGEADYERVRSSYSKKVINALVCGFLDNIGAAYSLADLVICRAGATTIAEVTAVGIPAVFVPYPYATDNHQYWNAKAIAEKGGGIIIEEAALTPQRLLKVMSEVLQDDKRRLKMKNVSKSLGKPDATTVIVNLICHIIERNTSIGRQRTLCPLKSTM
ncbi:MAG TPA: undecaprenyldiphospho-muramoylpentapeptide beta-N-acetylglucosaminyltransferase [Candidatus Brocadiia bacterium]|nr:undecaprenyldiphospho-muramoylpentapeptide beta-N-acetylglucosaminyltransferase [Planctomycetota bacterium]